MHSATRLLLFFLIWLHFVAINKVCGAQILAVFPTPSYSHQIVFKVYIEALLDRGHDVTVIKPTARVVYDQNGYYNKSLHIIDTSFSESRFQQLMVDSTVFRKRGLVADSSSVTARNYMNLVRLLNEQFNMPQVKHMLKNRKATASPFNLIIVESFLDYSLIFSHLFEGAPVIQISSGHALAENYETVGAVARHPVYYPNLWRDKFGNSLTPWQLLNEIYKELKLQHEFNMLTEEQNQLLRQQYGSDTPSIQELRNNVRLLLVNTHPVFDNNRPVPPSVQYLGGLHLQYKKTKRLTEYVQQFLDASVKGLVYVSFGSSVSSKELDSEFVTMLLDTFAQLPYNVAWKFDAFIESSRLPANVLIQVWFDQYSLLHHENVKAFVTQGGVQSTDEAVDALVPLVGIPIMGDQAFNTNKYVELGIGCVVDTLSVDSASLRAAIERAATHAAYRVNLKRLRHFMTHQPVTPLKRAIWYTEHVIDNKAAPFYLKTQAANVTYYDYCMLYLIAPLVVMYGMNHLQQLLRMTFF
nr:egt [Calliteara abietis nucleopolyhedrovirus]